MNDLDGLLFPVFDYLRRRGFPIGISEYTTVIGMLRSGIGLEDIHHLKNLCRLLWVKSREDQELFDIAYERFIESRMQSISDINLPKTKRDDSRDRQDFPQTSPPTPELSDEKDQQLHQPEDMQVEESNLHSIALQHSNIVETDIDYRLQKYHFHPRLSPTTRDMAEAWRQLRRLSRTGPLDELDLQGTINSYCKTGFFLGPKLRSRRRNQAILVLLVDAKGSMAPFSMVVDALIESILRSGLIGRVSFFYFHDCPDGFLFKESNLTTPVSIEDVLSNCVKNNCVLIVSDGGSSRGFYDEQRVNKTRAFLDKLITFTYLQAWLNPMPTNRWVASSAEDISRLTPMFHVDRDGLNDVVNVLRGHPYSLGGNLDAN